MKIEIFDPPMCCSTGICGPSVDPALVRFAADLDWLKSKGVTVARDNLAQQPGEFATNPDVRTALTLAGNACLPFIIVDGTVASRGLYPDRQALAAMVGLDLTEKDRAGETL
jgi:hypothetical protein